VLKTWTRRSFLEVSWLPPAEEFRAVASKWLALQLFGVEMPHVLTRMMMQAMEEILTKLEMKLLWESLEMMLLSMPTRLMAMNIYRP